ncbi:hypothetical protein Bca4012_045477 [Brassica carinata]
MDRVETTIADEIAESLFVDFNGKKCISWYMPTVTNGWQDFHLPGQSKQLQFRCQSPNLHYITHLERT